MTHRILPPSEYGRLHGTPLGAILTALPTEGVIVIVVEDEDQIIHGHWTMFTAMHAEQVWVRPTDRKKGVVVKHLLAGLAETAATLGISHYITHSASDEVTRILKGLGASRLPGDPYAVPVRKD